MVTNIFLASMTMQYKSFESERDKNTIREKVCLYDLQLTYVGVKTFLKTPHPLCVFNSIIYFFSETLKADHMTYHRNSKISIQFQFRFKFLKDMYNVSKANLRNRNEFFDPIDYFKSETCHV